MKFSQVTRTLLIVGAAVGLMLVVACSSDEDETPVATATAAAAAQPTVQSATPAAAPTAAPTVDPSVRARAVPPLGSGEQPIYGGTFIIGEFRIEMFDMLAPRANGSTEMWLARNVFNGLVRVSLGDRQTIEGDWAESWTLSDDLAEYTFKIRDNLIDHEGDPVTAEDAWYQFFRNIERPAGIIAPAQACQRLFVKPLEDDGFEVIDPQTLVVRLKSPRAAFLQCMTVGFGMFGPMKYTKAIDDAGTYRDLNEDEIIGTGPFKVVQAQRDIRVDLERNEDFFRPGLPYLDGFTVLSIPEAATRVAAFRSGRIDRFGIFGGAPTKRDVDQLKSELGDKLAVAEVRGMGWAGLVINTESEPLGDNANLRRAIQLTLDRVEINNLSRDGIGFLSPAYFIGLEWIYPESHYLGLPGYNPDTKEQDIAEAKKLMEQEGFGPDNILSLKILSTSTGVGLRRAEAIASELKEIYMDVELLKLDGPSFSERQRSGDFQMFSADFGGLYFDPDAFNIDTYLPFDTGNRNFARWENDEFLGLFDQQAGLVNNDARAPLLRRMADIIYEDAYWIGLIRPTVLHTFRSNQRGWSPPITTVSNYTLESVWLAK